MKRPLLWAVIWFAFGEVNYLIVSSIKQTGMLLWMPVCFAFIFICLYFILKRNVERISVRKTWFIFLGLFLIGFFWSFFRLGGLRQVNKLYELSRMHQENEMIISEDVGADAGERKTEGASANAGERKLEDEGANAGERKLEDEGADAGVRKLEDKGADEGERKTENGWIADRGKIYVRCYGRIEEVIEQDGSSKLLVNVEYTEAGSEIFNNDYKVYINSTDGFFLLGQYIDFSGILNEYEPQTNLGGFDRKKYYENRRIMGYFKSADVRLINEKRVSLYYKYLDFLQDVRKSAGDILLQITDFDTAAILSGILLGDKSNIDKNISRLYQVSGIAHILAISGLHISLIGGFLYKLIRRLGLGFLPAAFCAISLITSYGLMTGFKTATCRAVIMLSVYIFGQVLGRTYDLPTGMAIALLTVLTDEPSMIMDGGTILSFGAILGVILAQYLKKILVDSRSNSKSNSRSNSKSNSRSNSKSNSKSNNKPRNKIRNKIRYKIRYKPKKNIFQGLFNSFLFSFSVNIMTLPIICYLYYEFPLYSILINLIVIPLMTLVVLSGILPVILCLGIPEEMGAIYIGRFLVKPAEWILKLYDYLCNVFLELPCSTINIGKVTFAQILLYYFILLVIIILLRKESQRKLRELIYKITYKYPTHARWNLILAAIGMAIIFSGGILIYLMGYKSRGECIVFMDVGQGDGILIRSEAGTDIVIDGGSSSIDADALAEYTIIPSIKYMGMAQVDYWFVSHTDADHMNGLYYIISNGKSTGISIKNLVLSKYIQKDSETLSLINLAMENGINIIWTYPGSYITDGLFSIITCHPYEAYVGDKDKNQCSLALAYVSQKISILMLADMDTEAIDYMLENEKDIVKQIVKYQDCAMQKYQSYDVIDIIKIPHHGSKNSLSGRLYTEYKFENAVISCGKRNRYGHPHEEILKTLEKTGANVFRTDESGAIEVRFKGDKVRILVHDGK